jgi:hypothetical protein
VNPALSRQRCWTHPQREAVSRCPSCRRFYCRECVTEHDRQLLCVSCLANLAAPPPPPSSTRWLLWSAAALLGLALSYSLFYVTGHFLQQLPPSWTGAPAEDQ